VEGEPYGSLLRAMGGRFFPTILYLDESGDRVAEHAVDRPRTTEAFLESLGELRRLRELSAKEERSKAEEVERLLLEIRLLRVDHDEAAERRAAIGDVPEAEKLTGPLANLEASGIMEPRPRTRADAELVGEELRDMAKAGRIPTDERLLRGFWGYQIAWAIGAEHAEGLRTALDGYRQVAGDDERTKRRIAEWEAALEKMERDAGK